MKRFVAWTNRNRGLIAFVDLILTIVLGVLLLVWVS